MALSAYFVGSGQVTSGNTVTITPSNPTSQGDAIVILMGNSGSTQPLTITDTASNVYTAAAVANTTTPDAVVWEATNTNALSTTDTITITFPGGASTQNKTAFALGGSGLDASVTIDITSSAQGSSTTPALTTPKLQIPNEIAFAVLVNGNGGGAPGTFTGGWTQQSTTIHNASAQYTSVFTQLPSSTAALSFGATIVSAPWSVAIITVTGPSQAVQVNFSEAYCFSVTTAQGASVAASFHESFSFSVQVGATLNPKVVNVWQYENLSNYGLSAIPIANTSGNALIVMAAWNGAAVNPVANVSDDAHNFWTHGATSAVGGDNRCSIWIAPNAQAATNLSVGLSWFAQALTVVVAEVQNFPTWAQVDFVATNFGNQVGNLTVSGTATVPDFVFGCGVSTPTTGALIRSQGWNFIGGITAQGPFGNQDPATTQIMAVWQAAQAGSVSIQWTPVSGLANMSGVLVGFKQSVTAPVQKNPSYPAMHVEMALGYQPGDPTQVPTWTDVTSRAINESGQTAIKTSRGRQYESEAPEAGDLVINMRNDDGALTPGNPASPYFPNIQLGTPVRVWATWNGRAYAVQQGYVERFPQTWPDNPQYGIVPMEAVDALDPLANSVLPSALGGDILTDLPYAYFPCGDTYLQNEAAGLPFANAARTNQRPMVGTDATFLTGKNPQTFNRRHLQTGLQWQTSTTGQVFNFLGLPGDSATGIGCSDDSNQDISKGQVAVTPVPGAFYEAPDFPQPVNGATIEFWAIVDKSFDDAGHDCELFRIDGQPPNYYYNKDRSIRMAVRATLNRIDLFFFGPFGSTEEYEYTGVTPTDGNYHHYAVSLSKISGVYVFNFYMDGVPLTPLGGTTTPGFLSTPQDWNYMCLGAVPHNDGGVAYGYIYTAGQAAYYPSVVGASRIASHYNAGNAGAAGDDTVSRVAKLMTWGGFGLARSAAPPSPSPLLGVADQIQGTAVADAINTIAQTDGGMFFVDGAGNATWWPRTFLYNRPVKWTLGDNPGETPYDPAEAYDFDNTFIQNTVTIQRQANSQAQGASISVADQSSQKQYFIRPGTQQTIETTSDEDAFDQAEWTIAKYKQPSLRVQQVVLNPVANPSVWPVALGIEQGDIAMLTRRPLGGAVISQKCIVQSVSHDTGPDKWQTTLNLIPYVIESGVLTCDTAGFDVVGSNGIGW